MAHSSLRSGLLNATIVHPPQQRGLTAAVLVALCVLLALVPKRAHAEQPIKPAAQPISAVVTIAPLHGLVAPLIEAANQRSVPADCRILIPPGVSEHGFEIPPAALASVSKADVVVLIGLGLEPQVEKILRRPGSSTRRVVNAGEVLKIEHDAHDADHVHGPDCDHSHGTDPHVWLDPVMVEKLVPAIADAVRKGLDTASAERVSQKERELLERVRSVHAAYTTTLEPARVRTIVVAHDAWRRLAERYNLKTVAVKGLTATEPTPASMQAAASTIRELGLRVVFTEPQLSPTAGRKLASATGARVLELDPLGDGDWVKLMHNNLRALAAALEVEPRIDVQPLASPAKSEPSTPAGAAK